MSILRALRKRGHEVSLEDLTVVVTCAPSSDFEVAEAWARKHEQELRAELVDETRKLCDLPSRRRRDGTLPKVLGPDGAPIVGQITVRVRVEEAG